MLTDLLASKTRRSEVAAVNEYSSSYRFLEFRQSLKRKRGHPRAVTLFDLSNFAGGRSARLVRVPERAAARRIDDDRNLGGAEARQRRIEAADDERNVDRRTVRIIRIDRHRDVSDHRA